MRRVAGGGTGRIAAGLAGSQRSGINIFEYMPTSVHIPKPLLEAVDRRARALKISRNRLIVQALEREITQGSDWSPGFFSRLETPSTEVKRAVDDMETAIAKGKGSKKPVQW